MSSYSTFRRRRWIAGLLVFPGVWACGCASMSHTEKGMGAGGLIGAGTGAIVGNALGSTAAGAAIGAGVGALSGGLIGSGVDQAERRAEARAVAAAQEVRSPLGMTDVIQLTHQHVSDDIIISQIRSTGSVFYLSAQDIVLLKQNGVSDPVVREMQLTSHRRPRRVYTPTPVYAAPVYIVEPAPPPPPIGVGFGFSYSRRR